MLAAMYDSESPARTEWVAAQYELNSAIAEARETIGGAGEESATYYMAAASRVCHDLYGRVTYNTGMLS